MKALIIYASWTGTTMEIAEILSNNLQKLGIDTIVKECTEAYPQEFVDYDICVIATYTYGSDGAIPEESEDFFYDLEGVNLKGKIYGVLGSGDLIYPKFCPAVDDFSVQFEKAGAIKGSDNLKINLQADAEDKKRIEKFALELKETAVGIVS